MDPAARATAKASLATGACALLAFGVAHVIWITPLVERDPGVPLVALLGVMLAAPMLVGALPVALMSGLLGVVWHVTRARLAGWRFGAVLALGFAPVVVGAAVFGGTGDDAPPALGVATVAAASAATLAAAGAWAGGWRPAVLLPVSVAPVFGILALFFFSVGLNAWTTGFAASILVVLVASGVLVERFAARWSAGAADASSALASS